MAKKQVQLRIDETLNDAIQALASARMRSKSNLIEVLARDFVEENRDELPEELQKRFDLAMRQPMD